MIRNLFNIYKGTLPYTCFLGGMGGFIQSQDTLNNMRIKLINQNKPFEIKPIYQYGYVWENVLTGIFVGGIYPISVPYLCYKGFNLFS